jgi:hypothetical protein
MKKSSKFLAISAATTVLGVTGCLSKQSSELQSGTTQPEMHSLEGDSYERLPGCKKEQILANYIKDSVYPSRPNWTGREAVGIFTFVGPREQNGRDFMSVSLDHSSDVLPTGRDKVIHTFGSAATVRFIADPASPFTGVFAGAECALLRAAPAFAPTDKGMAPGFALKFLVDGRPSVNIFAVHSLDGQTEGNFFKYDMSNFLAPPTGKVGLFAVKIFNLGGSDALKVHAGHLARVTPNGKTVDESSVRAPEQLFFVPNREKLVFSDVLHEVRDDFETIPEGTKLFDVYGGKAGAPANERIRIGQIVTKSRFLSSRFGDERLFFKHKRIDSTQEQLKSE